MNNGVTVTAYPVSKHYEVAVPSHIPSTSERPTRPRDAVEATNP